MSVRKFLVAVALLAIAAFSLSAWRTHNRGPVYRGRAIAQQIGCFACHGEAGGHGISDPGYALGDIPTWNGGLLTMYVDNAAEIEEWVRDGIPARIKHNPQEMSQRKGASIRMPAFRSYLSDAEIADVVAYVKAIADFDSPEDDKAADGMKLAETVGCFSCHGPEGRGGVENPRSFKGYIPSWSGRDFPELAQNDAEIRDWIRNGSIPRLDTNRVARFFLQRQVVSMPAYGGQLKADEVDRLMDYIHWLRKHPDES